MVINKDEGDEVRVPLADLNGVIDLSIEFYYFDYTAEDDIHALVSFSQEGTSPSVDDHNPEQSEISKRFIATICVFEINIVAAKVKV